MGAGYVKVHILQEAIDASYMVAWCISEHGKHFIDGECYGAFTPTTQRVKLILLVRLLFGLVSHCTFKQTKDNNNNVGIIFVKLFQSLIGAFRLVVLIRTRV